MCTRTYDVQPGEPCPKKDNSYRQFICVILVFTALCILFVIIGNVSFKKPKTKHHHAPDQEDVELMPNHVTSQYHKYERLRTTSSHTSTTTTSKPEVNVRTTTTTTSTPYDANRHTTTTTTSTPFDATRHTTTTTTSTPYDANRHTTTTTTSMPYGATRHTTTTTTSTPYDANRHTTTTTSTTYNPNRYTATTTSEPTVTTVHTTTTTSTPNIANLYTTTTTLKPTAANKHTMPSIMDPKHTTTTTTTSNPTNEDSTPGHSTDVPISSPGGVDQSSVESITRNLEHSASTTGLLGTSGSAYSTDDSSADERLRALEQSSHETEIAKTTMFNPVRSFDLWSHIFTTPAGYKAVDDDVIVFNETLSSHEDLLATGINPRSQAFEEDATRTTTMRDGEAAPVDEETLRGFNESTNATGIPRSTTVREQTKGLGEDGSKVRGRSSSTIPTQENVESRTTTMKETPSTSTIAGSTSTTVDFKANSTTNLVASTTKIAGISPSVSTHTTTFTPTTASTPNAAHEKNPVDTTTTAKVTGVENKELLRKSLPVCDTSGCKSLGSRMLNLMEDTVDACEDFYAFSCSGMQGYTQQSDTYSILLEQTLKIGHADPSYLVKFRRFYNSCIDFNYGLSLQKRIAEVKNLLRKYDCDWPEAFERKTVTDLLAILLNINALPFLKLGHAYDAANNEYIPSFSLEEERTGFESSLWTNRRRCLAQQRTKIYEDDLNLSELYESYRKCTENDFREFGGLLREAVENLEEHDVAKISADQTFETVVEMLVDFPAMPVIKEDMATKNYTVFKISDLEKNIPSIEWRQLLSTLMKRKFESDDLVQVYSVGYLKKWLKEFANIKDNKHILLNLLRVHLYYNFVVRRVENVEDHCIRTTSAIFNDVSSKLYLEHFDKKTLEAQKLRAIDLFTMLKALLSSSLLHNNHTTSAAFKLQKIRPVFIIGTADADLEGEYGALDISDDYLDNVVNATSFQNRHIFDFNGEFASSYEEHPLANYDNDIVYIPMGMVVGVPLSAPKHVVLGKIGYKLAQALSKHFDPVGLKLGMTYDRKLYDTLVVNTNAILEEIFSKPTTFQAKPNKHLTIHHRVYDNTALRLVSDLYESIPKEPNLPWISEGNDAEQVMYIAIAQEFCEKENLLKYAVQLQEGNFLPGPFRLENVVQHSERFQAVFQCHEGSGMNNNPFKTQFPHIESDHEEEPRPDYDYGGEPSK